MGTWFTITIEDDLTDEEAQELLSDLEEAVAKKNYSLDIAQFD